MTREELKHITDLCFNVPVTIRLAGESRTYRCDECATAKQIVMDMLEQEPCEDCVSRQAVLDLIEHYNSDGLGSVFYGYDEGVKFANAVNKLPPVTPQPKQGRWKHKHDDRNDWLECPFCGYGDEGEVRMDQGTAFCPFCGTRLTRWDEGWML